MNAACNTCHEPHKGTPCRCGTEPEYPINEVLSHAYPDAGPLPCAECARRPGEAPRDDAFGNVALLCASCRWVFPSSELDFRLSPRELRAAEVDPRRLPHASLLCPHVSIGKEVN